jgi:hypothetical protein
MNEEEWLTSTNPWGMIDFVGPGASARKLRLFACACCRQVWNPFLPPFVIRVVEAAEAFADGELGAEVLAGVRAYVARAAAVADHEDANNGTRYFGDVLGACLSASCQSVNVAELAQDASHTTASAAGDGPLRDGLRVVRVEDRPPEFFAELAAQADLFRDVFGNPFRPVAVDPAWRTSTVVALARGIYADHAFDRMPILADALQDAGCDDEEILNHCREPREHARGCWVVDLVLGKK